MTSSRYAPRAYEVRHRTCYHYNGPVTRSYGRARLQPRDDPYQQVTARRIEISPAPALIRGHRDFFGNRSDYFEVSTRHDELSVEATSRLRVARQPVDVEMLDRCTVAGAATSARAHPVTASLFGLPSALVDVSAGVARYAERILPPDRPLGDALVALTHEIYSHFAYEQGSTTVTTSLDEVLGSRAGVCQDFAHLATGCLRHAGLPARYVSGYLETTPPPGRAKLEGSDASHAWCSVLTPHLGWVDLDPTNDHFIDSRYVVTAWGRDYRDVSPLKGVVFTESRGSTLEVAVDVRRAGDDADPATGGET